jgi:hypothetical protein
VDAAGNRSAETTISRSTNSVTPVPDNSGGSGALNLLFLIGLALILSGRTVRNT